MDEQSRINKIPWDMQVSASVILNSAPLPVVVSDYSGQIIYLNEKAETLFGYPRDEVEGQGIELLLPERFRSSHVGHRSNYMQNPYMRTMGSGLDLAARRKDGSEFPIEAGLDVLRVGADLWVLTTITDISRRKSIEELLARRVEERTREIERRRQVADELREILTVLNSNDSLEEVLAYIVSRTQNLLEADGSIIFRIDENSRAPVMQASLWPFFIEPTEISLVTDYITTRLINKTTSVTIPDITTLNLPLPTGHVCRAHLAVPIYIKADLYGGLILCYNNPREFSDEAIEVAATIAGHTALAIENARLRSQVESKAIAAERNRLARDLHDSVTQTLFSATMIADVLPRLFDRNHEEVKKRLQELAELTRGALAEMRTLLLELRPAKLMEAPIQELLRQLADATAGRTKAHVTLKLEGDGHLPDPIKVAFYRIAQEALNNVAKHARARHVQIVLQRTVDFVQLLIVDDGCGFTFTTIAPENLGLGIIRERAEEIDAALVIHSQPDQGTQVSVRWPAVNKGNAA